jgi:hypothetical protein
MLNLTHTTYNLNFCFVAMFVTVNIKDKFHAEFLGIFVPISLKKLHAYLQWFINHRHSTES